MSAEATETSVARSDEQAIDGKLRAGGAELRRLLDAGDDLPIELVKAWGRDLPEHLEAFWLGATALDRVSWNTVARPESFDLLPFSAQHRKSTTT